MRMGVAFTALCVVGGCLPADAAELGASVWVTPSSDASVAGYRRATFREPEPALNLVESSSDRIVLRFSASGFLETAIDRDGRRFQRLALGHFNGELPVGYPNLPTLRSYIYVPPGTRPVVDVRLGKPTILRDVVPFPMQKPISPADREQDGFDFDSAAYQRDVILPRQQVTLDPVQIMGGDQLALLHVCPFRYNPARQTLQAFWGIDLTVRFVPVRGGARVRLRAPESAMNRFVGNIVANPGSRQNRLSTLATATATSPQLLIVTVEKFKSVATALRNHKLNFKGINTVVESVPNGSTSVAIKNVIRTYYQTPGSALAYVLLLGDVEDIPTRYYDSNEPNEPATFDLYYSTLEGNDLLPDVFLGRIPVDTLEEAQVVVDKIINYEKYPPTNDAFYRTVGLVSYFQDGGNDGYADMPFARVSETVGHYLHDARGYDIQRAYYTDSTATPTHWDRGRYGNGEPISADPVLCWDATYRDIADMFNGGAFLVFRTDHGFDLNQGDPFSGWMHPEYRAEQIPDAKVGLNNGNLLPVVVMVECSTGYFDGETDIYNDRSFESFAEVMLRHPYGGAVGIFAATRPTMPGYADYLGLGIIDTVWPDFLKTVPNNSGPSARLGPMLSHGKLAMDILWGHTPNDLRWKTFRDAHYTMYNLLGDPTLEMRTRKGGSETINVETDPTPGIPITVTPRDISGAGSGVSPFSRNYPLNASVTLQAPPSFEGRWFRHWQVNGASNLSRSIKVAARSSQTVTAVYSPRQEDRTVLVIDRDPNQDCTILKTAIEANGFRAELRFGAPLPIDPERNPAVFVCLGEGYNVLSDSEAGVFQEYLERGGNLYIEGHMDFSVSTSSALSAWLGLSGYQSGFDALSVSSVPGSITDGYQFGINRPMTELQIEPYASGVAEIWRSGDPSFATGVAREEGTYRTIVVSFDFAEVPESLRSPLMKRYLDFFAPFPKDRNDVAAVVTGRGVLARDVFADPDWKTMTSSAFQRMATGDCDGDGLDDLFGVLSSGIWIRYTKDGTLKRITGGIPTWLSKGDMNGDSRVDVLAGFSTGVKYYSCASSRWVTLSSSSAQMGAAGDLDGDRIDDPIVVWSTGTWARKSSVGSWSQIRPAATLFGIAAGDINNDGRDEYCESRELGIWCLDLVSGGWRSYFTDVHRQAEQIAMGDVDGDESDDILGVWKDQPEGVWLWVTFNTDKPIGSTWERLATPSKPKGIAVGNLVD